MERLWFWQTPGCTESSWLRLAVQVVTAEQQSRWGDRFSHTQKRTHTCAHKPTLNAAHFLLDCCLFLSAVFCRLPRHVHSVSSTAFLSCRFLNKEKKSTTLKCHTGRAFQSRKMLCSIITLMLNFPMKEVSIFTLWILTQRHEQSLKLPSIRFFFYLLVFL